MQLLYRTDHEVGKRLVSHPKIGATGYTGSRAAGLALKAAADAAGKPIYLELSSINPVYVLPGAIRERGSDIVEEFRTSCLMGAGQFCTNPGIVVLLAGAEAEGFIARAAEGFDTAPVGTLLAEGVESGMEASVRALQAAGAELVTGGRTGAGTGYSFSNTLLRTTASRFLGDPEALQTEAFGNESLFVVADDVDEAAEVARRLEGNLTGCIYSDTGGSDDDAYERIAPALRRRVGRLLNDKMPTGVAVVPSMNHGGPYPATGTPRLHRRRHPRLHAALRHALLLRRGAPPPSAGGAAGREPRRRLAPHRRELDPGGRVTRGGRQGSAASGRQWSPRPGLPGARGGRPEMNASDAPCAAACLWAWWKAPGREHRALSQRLPVGVVGGFGGEVLDVEVGRLQAAVPRVPGAQAALQDPADDERPFRREGGRPGGQHLVDLGHQAGRVGDVRRRRQQELARHRIGLARQPGRRSSSRARRR